MWLQGVDVFVRVKVQQEAKGCWRKLGWVLELKEVCRWWGGERGIEGGDIEADGHGAIFVASY